MKKSESIKELASALKDFQAEVKNPKNVANNPFFNSKYAPLDEVINTVKEPLSKYGLSYIQMPNSEDGNLVAITTMLLHESGEWIESEPLKLKSDKPTAQGSGSSITYARRYQLSAMLGIASEDEDDGTATAHTISEAKEPKKITTEQAEEIRSLSKEKKISEEYICKFRKVNRFEDLQENDWKAAMEWLRKK